MCGPWEEGERKHPKIHMRASSAHAHTHACIEVIEHTRTHANAFPYWSTHAHTLQRMEVGEHTHTHTHTCVHTWILRANTLTPAREHEICE